LTADGQYGGGGLARGAVLRALARDVGDELAHVTALLARSRGGLDEIVEIIYLKIKIY